MSKAMQLKAQIRNFAKESGVPAQAVLQNLMLERLLERISKSPYKRNFVLKGGMLIASLVGAAYRTTMDMDATIKSRSLSKESLEDMLKEICAIDLDDDIRFGINYLEEIREDDIYDGYRVALIAYFENIRTPLKLDLTTGDKLTPGAVLYPYISIFEEKTIEVWAYNVETILAEKVETILRRSALNTRARDFYDVYFLVKTQGARLDIPLFKKALKATITHRKSSVSPGKGKEILASIRQDATMQERWKRYTQTYPYASGLEFEMALETIDELLDRMIRFDEYVG